MTIGEVLLVAAAVAALPALLAAVVLGSLVIVAAWRVKRHPERNRELHGWLLTGRVLLWGRALPERVRQPYHEALKVLARLGG